MGLYECIHNCGLDEEGNTCFCVSMGSSLDSFQSTSWQILCNKHNNIRIGSKFRYNLRDFINKFGPTKQQRKVKNLDYFEDVIDWDLPYIYDVEVVDIKDVKIKNGTVEVIRMKVPLDCSTFIESRKINFSMFDGDVTSWEKCSSDDSSVIITLQFHTGSIYRPCYKGTEYFYSWNSNKVIKTSNNQEINEKIV